MAATIGALKIDIETSVARLQQDIGKMRSQFGQLASSMDRVGSAASRTAAHTKKLIDTTQSIYQRMNSLQRSILRVYATFYILQSAVSAVARAMLYGMSVIDAYRLSTIKMAAMMTGMMEPDNRSLAARYEEATIYASELNKMIEKVDKNTLLTADDLRSITEEMMKQGVVVNTNNAEQVKGFTALANSLAVIAQGMPNKEIQLRQEVRALIQGQLRDTDQLAKMLNAQLNGRLKEQVALHREAGDLIEWLGQQLQGFAAAQGDINASWEATKTTLETIWKQVLRDGFGGAYTDILSLTKDLSAWAEKHKEEIGTAIAEAWNFVKIALGSIYEVLVDNKDIIILTGKAALTLLYVMEQIALIAPNIGKGIRNIAQFLAEGAKGVAGYAQLDWEKSLKAGEKMWELMWLQRETSADAHIMKIEEKMNRLWGLSQPAPWETARDQFKGWGSAGGYGPPKMKPKVDADALKGATDALASWEKKLADIRTEIQKGAVGMTDYARTLLDIENKFKDLKAEAAKSKFKLPTGELEGLKKGLEDIAQIKETERLYKLYASMDEKEQKRVEDAAKDMREIGYTYGDLRLSDTQRTLAKINRDEREALDKLAVAWRESGDDFQVYVNREADIWAKFEGDRTTFLAKQAAARSQFSAQERLAELDYMKELKIGTPLGDLQGRLAVSQQMLQSYQDQLQAVKDIVGSDEEQLTLQTSIGNELRTIAKIRAGIAQRTGTYEEGIKKGFSDWAYDAASAFEQGAASAVAVANTMEEAMLGFLDTTGDAFLDWEKLVINVLHEIQQEMLKALIVKPIVKAMTEGMGGSMNPMGGFIGLGASIVSMITGGGASSGAGLANPLGGTLPGGYTFDEAAALPYHAGGLVKKLHEGGYPVVKPDETMALLQNDEYVLNRNATRSLGTGALNQLNSGRMPGGTFSINVPISINGMMPEAVMGEIRRDIPALVEQETIRIMKRHM